MNAATASSGTDPPVRAFVAIEPGKAARTALEALQDRLAAAAPRRAVRWVRPAQCHLTLRFLGNVPPDRLPELEQRLTETAAACPAFSLALAGPGAFPTPAAPRVLWVGLRGDLEALAALARRVDTAAADLGDHQEEREFHPHLTLGRVVDRDARVARALSELLACTRPPPPADWPVREFILFRSELRPEGAVYSVLASFALRPAA